MDDMVSRHHDHPAAGDENPSPVDHAVARLVRAVLSDDQQALLTAFEAIADPKVRRSLIDLARAVSGLGDPPLERDAAVSRPVAEEDRDLSPYLRRLRRPKRPMR